MQTQYEKLRLRSDMTVDLIQHVGNDEMLARAAMVSTKGALSTEPVPPEKVKGLLGFLLKNRHGTPFEHASMTFFVQAPIFVFREWHRHRVGWSYNEESARYKQMDPVFYTPAPDRNLIQVGKPGHYTFQPGTKEQHLAATHTIEVAVQDAYARYEAMLQAGVAREVARAVLPVNTYSSMWATCNPRSMMHFLSLRTKSKAAYFPSFPQREIEMCAEKMEAEFARLFPITYAAYCENGRVCP